MTSRTLIPSVHAASTYTVSMYAYINVSPNPTGVNQQVEIIMWLEQIFGQNAELTNNYRFTNSFEIVVTAPDGTNTSTIIPFVQSPTSDVNYYYTPTTVGTYTLTFNFLGQNVTAANDPTSTQIGDEVSTNIYINNPYCSVNANSSTSANSASDRVLDATYIR